MSTYIFIDRKTKQLVRYHNKRDQYHEVIERIPRRLKLGTIIEGRNIHFENTENTNCVTYQYWKREND